jgi:GMP synthase-like glutamine amidotransferase
MGSSGLLDLDVVIPLITAGLAVVVEGGDPSVRDASTFGGAKCSQADLHQVVERLLILRSPTSALALLICLGHQLAAQEHINLIKQAVRQVLS